MAHYPKFSVPDTVLIAVDENEHSSYAVTWYCEHVHKPGNEVVLVHCVDAGNTSSGGDANARLQREERLLHLEQDFIDKLSVYNIDATIKQLIGKPGEAIVKAAEEEYANIIVTGTRGLSALKRTFLGSVSDYIVHHSTVPVLVCKSKEVDTNQEAKKGEEDKDRKTSKKKSFKMSKKSCPTDQHDD